MACQDCDIIRQYRRDSRLRGNDGGGGQYRSNPIQQILLIRSIHIESVSLGREGRVEREGKLTIAIYYSPEERIYTPGKTFKAG